MPACLLKRAPLVMIFAAGLAVPAPSWSADGPGQPTVHARPLLGVLRDTGTTRDGVPVYAAHPDAARYVAGLTRGMSGRLLRLYALEQHYLQVKKGIEPEPAYLLVSNNQGGFPRFGFYLGASDKRTAGYVDLEANLRIGGRFGAMDQIFPHELGHVILVQLAGPPQRGGSNQMHAIGVRTDRCNAFNEGFAEHLQVMAIDDADALAETRALLHDGFFERRAAMQLREYTAEVTGIWPMPGRRRIAFPLWFSGSEQALRYYAVKANAFARQPSIPDRLLHADPYGAYLLENILPGRPSDPPKNASQLASTEGVVAALFVRWVTDAEIQAIRREPAFYEPFGVAVADVMPLENAYLKLFHSMFVTHPTDLQETIAGYEATFPDEAPALARIVRAVMPGRSFGPAPAIWLANDGFQVGTSLFDQFRSQPRVHVFDLNAASVTDLVAVAGVSPQLANEIRRSAPYASLDDLRRVKGTDPSLVRRFRAMQARSQQLRDDPTEEESRLSLASILRPYLIRLAVLIVVAGLLGAAAYRLAVAQTWYRAILDGIAAATVGALFEIALDLPAGMAAIIGPLLLFGLPAALYCVVFPGRTRPRLAARRPHAEPPTRLRVALAVLFAWLLAPLPLVLLLTPHF